MTKTKQGLPMRACVLIFGALLAACGSAVPTADFTPEQWERLQACPTTGEECTTPGMLVLVGGRRMKDSQIDALCSNPCRQLDAIRISGLEDVQSLDELPFLRRFERVEHVSITSNPGLVDLGSVPLGAVRMSGLEVSNNPELRSVSALGGVREVKAQFKIALNESLETVVFDSLEHVIGEFQLRGKSLSHVSFQSLRGDLQGAGHNEAFEARLLLTGMPQLTSLAGVFPRVEQLQELLLGGLDDLDGVDGFEGLQRVRKLRIGCNANLSSDELNAFLSRVDVEIVQRNECP